MGRHALNPSRKGDLGEHYAITWLWDSGFEVYKNAGCSGPVDIIAMKGGRTHLFDIKHKDSDKSWGHHRTELQKTLGVEIIEFDPTDRSLRIVEHRQ